jgi:rhodanese-related sulfurtransferase
MSVKQLTPQELKNKIDANDNIFLLDVREPFEFSYAHIENSVLIPLNDIPQNLQQIDFDKEIVVVCHHGIRSQQAAIFLAQVGFKNVRNLSGGIDAWSLECDQAVPRY